MKSPPRLEPGGARPAGQAAAWAFAALLGLLGAARLTLVWPWVVPVCFFKRFTGIPCPFCGGTRCLQSLASLDPGAALLWNPLVFAGCLGVAAWFCLSMARRASGRGGRGARRPGLVYRGVWLAALVLANWVYLWIRLP